MKLRFLTFTLSLASAASVALANPHQCSENFLALGASQGLAHARVALSGSHTDYNSGFTLAGLLSVSTQSEVIKRDDSQVHVQSGDKSASFRLGSEKLSGEWSDYIKGITSVLKQEGFKIGGFDLKIETTIPFGAGISSSAALVTSVFKALRAAYDLPIDDTKIAKLGQKVEHFVGANTGLLDQMTISLLSEDTESALFIDFKDLSTRKVKMPNDAEFVILHSGLTHSLTDVHGDRNYATRRKECEEASRLLGISNLSQIDLRTLAARKTELPLLLYKRALHIVSENERVLKFIDAAKENSLQRMGAVMNESHESQKNNYDISERPIDALVQILQHTEGVYGAQLTGGGFGGAVVFLARKGEGRGLAEKVMPFYLNHSVNGGKYVPSIITPGK